MNDKQFDQQLGQALKHLDVPYDPSTWALLEQRLDGAVPSGAPDDAVDHAVFQALSNIEAPFQSAHWELMDKRLRQQAVRVRRLRLAKFAEAAIFLLLLANIGVFVGRKSSPAPLRFHHHSDVPVAEALPGSSKSARQGGVPGGSARAAAAPVSWLPTAVSAYGLSGANTNVNVLTQDYLTDPNIAATLDKLDQMAESAAKPVYAGFSTPDLLPYNALADLNVPNRFPNMPTAGVTTRPFRQRTPVYVATYASAQQNRININGKTSSNGGFGAGIAAGYRGEKWGVEAGIGYSQTRYTPKKQVEIYGWDSNGYYGSTQTEVSGEMIAVPVKVSRRIARLGKTTAHAVAGMTAHFAAEKNYDYHTIFYPDPLPATQPGANQKPKLRDSGRGLLEGGQLNDNFYASIDAGVRIEHPIAGGRYKAFIEPTYRQNISNKGIGPKREPINSFVVQAGVMAFL